MVKSLNSLVSKPQFTPEQFVLQAIAEVKDEGRKGLSSWKLNPRFREYFGKNSDPVAVTTKMRKDGQIAIFLNKGGASFYLREDLKASTLIRHDDGWVRLDAKSAVENV
jgi:hypothetical protein